MTKASFVYRAPARGYTVSTCADCYKVEHWRSINRRTGKPSHCTPGTAKFFARKEGWRPLDKREIKWVCPACANARGLAQQEAQEGSAS